MQKSHMHYCIAEVSTKVTGWAVVTLLCSPGICAGRHAHTCSLCLKVDENIATDNDSSSVLVFSIEKY